MNLFAQLFGTIAVIIMFLSYLKTTKARYLFLQILCNVFFAIQFFCVSAFSAAGICIITIFKSFAFYKYENENKRIPMSLLILFELITIAFGIYIYTDFNSLLPIIISCFYTYGTWQKNLNITYSVGTFASVVWIVYNFIVGAYVAIIGNVAEFIASLIGMYKLAKLKRCKLE